MAFDGKAGIIIGGHTSWDEKGRIQAGKNRIFFNYLYSHYNVIDVININGHKLYSRQGTAFNVRLILIDGRKEVMSGASPVYNPHTDTEIKTFEELFERVIQYVSTDNTMKTNIKKDNVLAVKHHNLFVSDYLPEELSEYDYVFIDSVNKMELQPGDLEALKEKFPSVSFIYVFQTTKEGNFRGSNHFQHDVDVVIEVPEKGKAVQNGRFNQGGQMEIFKN